VSKDEGEDSVNMGHVNDGISAKSCVRDGCPRRGQISAQGSDVMLADYARDVSHDVAGAEDFSQRCSGAGDLKLQSFLFGGPFAGKAERITFECNPSLHHELTFVRIERRDDCHR
jgi:hypothetical protein